LSPYVRVSIRQISGRVRCDSFLVRLHG
jgi:hypothetical protein